MKYTMDFIDALNNLTVTENQETAFRSSGDKSLDLFVKVVRNSPTKTIVDKFVEAYNENPNLALRVLFNFRDIRNGKGEKLISFVILFWLKYHQPDIYNAIIFQMVNDLGCWKDILFLCDLTRRYKENAKMNDNHMDENDYNLVQARLDNEYEINLMKNKFMDDTVLYNKNEPFSLFPKWAPSEGKRYTFIAKDLAKEIGLSMAGYRKILTKMRNVLNLAETNLSNNREEQINFEALPSKCHNNYRKVFKRNTNAKGEYKELRDLVKQKYSSYLEKVEKGEAKINSTGLQPHELVGKYLVDSYSWTKNLDETVEAQWKDMVKKMKQTGSFEKALSIVDVSGSMSGQPMQVAIALGILTAECTKGKYSNQMITFSEKPSLIQLKGRTLHAKIKNTKDMAWGMNTNLEKVFHLILGVAVQHKLPPDQMVEKLFIFTDMQFDQVLPSRSYSSWNGHRPDLSTSWNSTFHKFSSLFQEHNYTFPQIICWNLRSSTSDSLPSLSNHKGVCMLSGFSGELLKVVMETKGQIDPNIMFNNIMKKYKPDITVDLMQPVNNQMNFNILDKSINDCKIKKKTI